VSSRYTLIVVNVRASPAILPILAAGVLFSVRADGQPTPVQIIRGPYLQALLQTTAEVIWLTDGPSLGRVTYSREDGSNPASITETGPSTQHRLKLSGLSPGTVYRYQVLDGDRVLTGGGYLLRTSPLPDTASFRVAAIGDSGTGSSQQRAVAGVIREIAPDLLLHTGDMTYLGDPDDVVFGVYGDILASACLYPVSGNHDEDLDWGDFFFPPNAVSDNGRRYYSFDWGSAHFVALDSNDDFQDQAQLDWLEADLGKARAAGDSWIIVSFHKPLYTVGGKTFEASVLRPALRPYLDRFEVDLVVNGHDHNYQRSHPVREDVVHDAWQSPDFVRPRGTIDVVTGGGGQVLYQENKSADHRFTARFIAAYHALELEISPTRLSVRAISAKKEVLDSFSIRKDAVRPEFRFLRGDVDGNGQLEITDAIDILFHLFGGGAIPGAGFDCPFVEQVVADVDDSRAIPEVTDAVVLLSHLFLGGPPPAPPGLTCGTVPGADDSWCTRSGCRR